MTGCFDWGSLTVSASHRRHKMEPKKMDPKILRQGIEEAEKELAWIKDKLAEMEPLIQRRADLDTYVAKSKALLPIEGTSSPREEPRPASPPRRVIPTKDRPIWSGARDVLAEIKRPMSAGDVTKELIARGWRLGKWGSEIVRAGMARKPDTFEKVGPVLYALKEWPDHLKRPQE